MIETSNIDGIKYFIMLTNENKKYYQDTRDSTSVIVDKLYLSLPACRLIADREASYAILQAISTEFSIPFRHIYTTGSAHIGFSLKKGHDFDAIKSDLDISIVDTELFNRYMGAILKETNAYSRQDGFRYRKYGIRYNNFQAYSANLTKGIIHPLYFPIGETKRKWDSFFINLSLKHRELFHKITACIYLSEDRFREKQIQSIEKYRIFSKN